MPAPINVDAYQVVGFMDGQALRLVSLSSTALDRVRALASTGNGPNFWFSVATGSVVTTTDSVAWFVELEMLVRAALSKR